MTRGVLETIVETTYRDNPIIALEDGQVWVSGMNANPWSLARRCRHAIATAGYEVGAVSDDGAAEHGGLLIPVPDCEPISDNTQQEVMADATGE